MSRSTRPGLRRHCSRLYLLGVLSICLAVCLSALLSANPSYAAGGGGGGGGGGFSGGGSGGGSGVDVNEVFREGAALLAAGECKKAEKKFRTVLKAVSRNAEANYLRGTSLQCLGKHKKALRYLKRAKKYNEQLYAAYEKLGVSYLALGKTEEARAELEALARLEADCGGTCPDVLTGAHRRLQTAIASEDPSDAAIEGTQEDDSASVGGESVRQGSQHGLLFETVAEPQTSYLAAIEQINRERFQAAIDELGRLTATVGPHPDVLNYLGYASRRLGRFEVARGYYEQALTLDPSHRGANEYLGEMWVELDRMDLAREWLDALRRACPFGCAEYEDLERIIESRSVASR